MTFKKGACHLKRWKKKQVTVQIWQMLLIAYITLCKACPLSTFLKLEPSAVLVQEAFPSFLPSIKDVLLLQADGDDSLISEKLGGIQKCQHWAVWTVNHFCPVMWATWDTAEQQVGVTLPSTKVTNWTRCRQYLKAFKNTLF